MSDVKAESDNYLKYKRFSLETWSAWAALQVAPWSLVLSVSSILITVIGVVFSVSTYNETKQADIRLAQAKTEQEKFNSILQMLKGLGNNSDTYMQLAVIKELESYPKYHHVYEYMLREYEKDEKEAKGDEEKDTLIEFIKATRELVDKTAAGEIADKAK